MLGRISLDDRLLNGFPTVFWQTASLVELHEVPLDAVLSPQSISCTSQFGGTSGFAE